MNIVHADLSHSSFGPEFTDPVGVPDQARLRLVNMYYILYPTGKFKTAS